MSDAPPTPPAQPVPPAAIVTNKIFVSGLGEGDSEDEIRQLFSYYGEVVEVIVDGTCATVTFLEERVVQEMEEKREIMLGGRELNIARVLEEHVDPPSHDAPFYQGVLMPAPAPYHQYGDNMLSNSYQPAYPYPVWYPQPTPSQYHDPAISDCGPVQPQQPCHPAGPASTSCHPASVIKPSTSHKSFFTFDTMATQLESQNYPLNTPTITPTIIPSITGCCQVCSTPAVHGVDPLAFHQVPGHPPYYGHQLQPLTLMTPSLNTGYLLPPTPTPTNLPPMTPTYYLPHSPAPTYMMYEAGADASSLPHTSHPPPETYTNLKSTDSRTTQEDINTQRQNVAFFTSPFKRFTKFRGTPTPARFPLRAPQVHHGYIARGSGGNGDSSSWYQQGDRWGHRSDWEGDLGYQQGVKWGLRSGGEGDSGYQQGDRWGEKSAREVSRGPRSDGEKGLEYQQGDRWGHRSGGEGDSGYQQGDRWGQKSVREGPGPDILKDCKGTQETKLIVKD